MKNFNFLKKIKKEKIFLPKESLKEVSGIEILKNIIAPSGLEINSNFLKLGNLYGKSFFIFSYPSYLDFGWLNEIINLERIFDIGIFFHPVDVSSALKQLRKKAAQIAAQIAELEEKGYVRDPELEAAYQNIERLRDALQKAQEKLFRVGFYLTLWAESLEELEAAEKEISLLLEGKLIYLKPAVFLQWEGAESCFPLGLDKIKVHNILDTLPASTFFPFVSLTLCSDEGVLYGINLHNSTPVILDRFSLENANMLVFAQSGAGKSYFAKLETIRSLMRDVEVLIIDPEKEYKNLAFALDGDFFDISIASDYKINPFDLPKGSPDESNEEILKSNILTLVGLLKLMLKEIPPEKEPLLYQALEKVYELRDITPKTDFSKITQYPLLSDLEAVLEGMEGGKELAQRLYPYTKGVYAGFLNHPTTIKIKNRLVVFSLRDLEEELRPIAMYLILNFIWDSIRSNLKRRIVLIIAVSVVFVFKINAQDTITVFYDLYMNRTADSSQATYIRKAWKIKDSKLWRVHDYYLKNGNIAMKGVYKSGRLNVKNGYFIYYYENGKKREEGSYRNNYRTGEWKGWFKEGNDKLIYKYETGTLKEVIA